MDPTRPPQALYARNSISGYGTHTPNYWKVARYGGPSKCVASNEYCYVCEPQSEHTSLNTSFSVFPEPAKAPTWKAATAYIEEWAAAMPTPQWHPDVLPGTPYTDPTSGVSSVVPGSNQFDALGRDPYNDLVHLAKELNCTGVDIDYEEFWHADTFKSVGEGGTAATGPWELHQTTYKLAAILKDVTDAIDALAPTMQLSIAAPAVGAWSGKWWGGNLKGVHTPRRRLTHDPHMHFLPKHVSHYMAFACWCAPAWRAVRVVCGTGTPCDPHALPDPPR